MKKLSHILLIFFLALLLNYSHAQEGTIILKSTSGSSISFPGISAAYAAIPSTPSSDFLIEILPGYNGTHSSEIYPIQLTDKNLANATITIRPALGNTSAFIKKKSANNNSIVQINGGDNIIIDGRPGGITSSPADYLTILNNDETFPSNGSIELLNGATSNTLQYINFKAPPLTVPGPGSTNIFIGGTTGFANANNKILNNIIEGGARGIYDQGNEATPNSGTLIASNTILNFTDIAILAGRGQTNITIENNLIEFTGGYQSPNALVGGINDESRAGTTMIAGNLLQNLTAKNGGVIGINISTTVAPVNINILRNKIINLSSGGVGEIKGIAVKPAKGSSINVQNNFISITNDNAAVSGISGIHMAGKTAYNVNLYFNSIRIGGKQEPANTATAFGINKDDSATLSVYNQVNNICLMERSGISSSGFIAFYCAGINGQGKIDDNIYYASDPVNGWAAGISSTKFKNNQNVAYKTFSAPNETSSNFISTSFISNTDLHLSGTSIADAAHRGVPVTGINIDIDGNPRSLNQPAKGADEPGGPVPVTMFAFSGRSKGNFNELTWNTASESNNKGFEVQRSVDGSAFTSIGFVASKADNGSSSTNISYSFQDNKPFTSTNFYRLKQLDKDGRGVFSNIVTVKGQGVKHMEISNLYPNPVKDNFNLVVASDRGGVITVWITDITGRTILQQNIKIKSGDNVIPLQIETRSSGVCILKITHHQTLEVMTTEFIKHQ